ncbi:glycine betaine ABC transporter substrate-binding protein [Bacillus coahuilensis]|uniref:glycine betaine ABC transporter substrate-binding protein n=1 Tax=Bacillus coahuilensis TaxID=408580 RepID=UPI000750C4E0|nr:glycine betaine ABC transporter substrate-binding protein [Bacillus coahuilensis]
MSNVITTFIDTVSSRSDILLENLSEHLFLSLISVLFAIVISLPLGVYISRKQKTAEWFIGVTAVFQTIPSLALFGFLVPLLGTGSLTAIIALIIYALLPILRNTYTGIISVDQAVIEAGKGMGMTDRQLLTKIELPLALPFIMAGIRTATVLTVGIATLATFVGAGGLGDLIYRGLTSWNNYLVLAGAIPAALLAILFDLILRWVEKRATPKGVSHKIIFRGKITVKKSLLVVALILSFIISACSNSEGKDPIVVSGKNWTEQYILTYVIAEYLEENTDYEIELKEGLGEVAVLTPALEKGEIDVYVEYTGTGLEAVLKDPAKEGESAEEVFDRVNKGYQEQYNAKWLEPLGFQNTYTLALRADEGIEAKTYSDLVPVANELVFGAPHPFYERADGFEALKNKYGFEFKGTESFDPNIMYEAVKNGEVDVITGFTTDARIDQYNLIATEDDLGLFPPYYAAPIVRMEVLEEYPDLEDTLNKLAGQITEEDMRAMNGRVDIDKEDYRTVARDFLLSKGLIEE